MSGVSPWACLKELEAVNETVMVGWVCGETSSELVHLSVREHVWM